MNTFFGIESDKCMKNDATIGFSRPSFPEITFSSPDAASSSPDAASSSPEPASLDDDESIIVPFPDDDNVCAPQPQPPQPQPRTIPVEEWTHLIHDSPEECIRCCKAEENKQYVRRIYRPRTGSNWIFLYRIQLEQGWYVNMEDVLSSMKDAWKVAGARKVWGRYSYQDPEHVRLWVWVNYRTRARITFHHLHGDLPCGARYDCVGYARMRLKAQQGKPIFERLMRGGEHDDGITFYMFA